MTEEMQHISCWNRFIFNIYGFSLPFTAVYNHKNIFVFILLQYIGIQVASKINRFPCPLQSAVVETRWGMQIPVNSLTVTDLTTNEK